MKDRELLRKQMERVIRKEEYADEHLEHDRVEAEAAATQSLVALYDRLHPLEANPLRGLALGILLADLLISLFVLYEHFSRRKG